VISFVVKRLSAAIAVVAFATAAFAQDFPKRPVTMIVPFAAGGTSDVIARTVAEQMGIALGQTIVIENVAGAGGSTALARASRAEPDGYTIAIGNAGTNAATYTIYPKLPFTPESFVPIAMVAKTFGIIAIRKDFPAKDLKEFIAYAKANPGKINLRCRRFRLAVDQREAGEGPRGRLDRAARDAARPSHFDGGRPARIRGAGLERPVRAQGHAAGGHRQAECSGAYRGRDRRGEEAFCRSFHRRAR
jgi:hypothetical protein